MSQWYNETLKKMKTEKWTLENKWLKSGTAQNHKLFKNKFNEYTRRQTPEIMLCFYYCF